MLGRDPINFLLQKTGHFTEYLILALVVYRAVRGTLALWKGRQPGGTWPACLLTVAVGVLFAVSDEWHQSFIPRRAPALRDVLIDSAGVLTALLLSRWLETRRQGAQARPEAGQEEGPVVNPRLAPGDVP